MKIFKDRFKKDEVLSAGVIAEEDIIRFLVQDVRGIFPAMHYLEAHPDMKDGRVVKVDQVDSLPESGDVEWYSPHLIGDTTGSVFAYQNYNFVVLNSGLVHPMSRIIEEYAEFVKELGGRQKKVNVVERPEHAFAMIEKIGGMKQDADYVVHSKDSHPTRIYLTAGSTSKGMTNRLGLDSAPANLEKRIKIR